MVYDQMTGAASTSWVVLIGPADPPATVTVTTVSGKAVFAGVNRNFVGAGRSHVPAIAGWSAGIGESRRNGAENAIVIGAAAGTLTDFGAGEIEVTASGVVEIAVWGTP
jgi:hypothetical protein